MNRLLADRQNPGDDLIGITLNLFNKPTNAKFTGLTIFHRPLERSTATRPYKGAIYDLERDPSLPLFTEAVDLHLDRPHGSFHVSGAQGPYQILVFSTRKKKILDFSHKPCSVLVRGAALQSHTPILPCTVMQKSPIFAANQSACLHAVIP